MMIKRKFVQFTRSVGFLFGMGFLPAYNAYAVDPATLAAGAAAADVVITVIGGLSSWIDNQSDDVAVAALGAEYGAHGLTKNEEKDTGYIFASATAVADGTHGHGFGDAWAEESLLGSWAGAKVDPYAAARTNGLDTKPDEHNATGFASSTVDGHVKATTKEAKQVAIQQSDFLFPPDLQTPSTATPVSAWNYTPISGVAGDVWLTIAIPTDSFLLQSGQAVAEEGTANIGWTYSVQKDGVDQFFASIQLDETGDFTVNSHNGVAGLNGNLIIKSVIDGVTNLKLSSNYSFNGASYYVTDILVDHLDVPSFGVGGEEAEYNIVVNSDLSATAHIAVVPEPTTANLLGAGLLVCMGLRRLRCTSKRKALGLNYAVHPEQLPHVRVV